MRHLCLALALLLLACGAAETSPRARADASGGSSESGAGGAPGGGTPRGGMPGVGGSEAEGIPCDGDDECGDCGSCDEGICVALVRTWLEDEVICRPAAGPCDGVERCLAGELECPPDDVLPHGALPAGGCGWYRCDGAQAGCPSSCSNDGDCMPFSSVCYPGGCDSGECVDPSGDADTTPSTYTPPPWCPCSECCGLGC